jgi:hypothetical protein
MGASVGTWSISSRPDRNTRRAHGGAYRGKTFLNTLSIRSAGPIRPTPCRWQELEKGSH